MALLLIILFAVLVIFSSALGLPFGGGLFFWVIVIFIIYALSRRHKKPPSSYPDKDRYHFLSQAIIEIQAILDKNPDKKLSDQLGDYKKELSILIPGKEPLNSSFAAVTATAPPKTLLKEDLGQVWSNWYSDNAINLLLYVGSFLIVASATIFVGFQWEQLGGAAKAMVFTVFTSAFLVAGFLFYRLPKIRNAGATFIAIAALLLPFNGLAWYNFVLKDLGTSFGSVWLTTSLIAIVAYATLAYLIRHPFYTYISGFGGLSIVLAFVNIGSLPSEYYILGAIFSAFVMLLATRILAHPAPELVTMYQRPLSLSAHIIMPVSLVWGLLTAIGTDKIFSLEVSLSLFIAILYYLVAYSFARQFNFFLVSTILLPINVYLFTNYLKLTPLTVAYVLQTLFFAYLLVTPYIRNKFTDGSQALTLTAVTGSVIVFIMGYAQPFASIHLTFMALFPTLFGLLAAYFQSRAQYLYVNFIFLAITVYLYFTQVLDLNNSYYLLGLAYTFTAIFFYLVVINVKDHRDFLQPFSLATILYLGLGFMLTALKPSYFLTTNLISAIILFDANFRFKKLELIYFSNLFINLSLWSILRLFKTDIIYYPFYFAGLSYAYYIAAELLPESYQKLYRYSALLSSFGNSLFFGLVSQGTSLDTGYNQSKTGVSTLEFSALFSAYSTFLLFSLAAVREKSSKLGYLASALGMACYLWQMKYSGVTHLQAYTLPLGAYFMTLAYLQRLSNQKDRREILDLFGLGFLFVPTFFQSFGTNGFLYALLLGLEGLAVFALGTSLNYKNYIYLGIGAIVVAIFSQTYVFLTSLPRWFITALAGLIILGVAIFLMLRRQEPNKE